MHTRPRGHNWLSFYSRVICQSGVGACARALSGVTPVWVQVAPGPGNVEVSFRKGKAPDVFRPTNIQVMQVQVLP